MNNFIVEIEQLYDAGEFQKVIDIAGPHQYSYLDEDIDMSSVRLIEIITLSYIELQMLSQAQKYIDRHILHLKENKHQGKLDNEDFTAFTKLKIRIFESRNSLLGQFRTLKDYAVHGGDDSALLEAKHITEEKLYSRYVAVNKIIMYAVIGLILFSIIRLLLFQKAFMSLLTTIGIAWYAIHFLFYRAIKRLFIKVLNIM